MKINKCEKTNSYTYELEIAFDADQVKEAVSKVYRKEAKKFNVPGFRKGHAPRNLIEKMYGVDVFYADAVNEIFPGAYEEFLKTEKLEPVAAPDAEILSVDTENGAVVKAIITVKPEVEVGEYKGLKVTKTIRKVEDKEIDDEIERMRERNSRLVVKEDKAEIGDTATINYEGFVDGVPFDGGKDDGHKLALGSGQFIPGFEEQVLGHKTGDEFDVKVTFPEEYHSEDLSGKDAIFKVKVCEVQYKELPELDDEFAKDVSEYDTLKELNDSIRESKQKEMDSQADAEVENQLMEQVIETLEGAIPEAMYSNRMDELAQDFAYRLQQQGLDIKTYLQYTGMDAKSFREGFKEQAVKQVKTRLAMEAIVSSEAIQVSDDERDAEIAKMAERYSLEADKVREMLPIEDLEKDIACNKALDMLKESAEILEEAPKAEERNEK